MTNFAWENIIPTYNSNTSTIPVNQQIKETLGNSTFHQLQLINSINSFINSVRPTLSTKSIYRPTYSALVMARWFPIRVSHHFRNTGIVCKLEQWLKPLKFFEANAIGLVDVEWCTCSYCHAISRWSYMFVKLLGEEVRQNSWTVCT